MTVWESRYSVRRTTASSASALTFAAPVMLVYLFAQRCIEGGRSFGGMEG